MSPVTRLVLPLMLLGVPACGGAGEPVQDLNISECRNPDGDTDVGVPSEELLLTGAQQALTVAHRAHMLNCNHDLDVTYQADEDARRVVVTYEDRTKDPADCTCLYDLAYRLEPLADGTWTVQVPGGQQAEGLVD